MARPSEAAPVCRTGLVPVLCWKVSVWRENRGRSTGCTGELENTPRPRRLSSGNAPRAGGAAGHSRERSDVLGISGTASLRRRVHARALHGEGSCGWKRDGFIIFFLLLKKVFFWFLTGLRVAFKILICWKHL